MAHDGEAGETDAGESGGLHLRELVESWREGLVMGGRVAEIFIRVKVTDSSMEPRDKGEGDLTNW